MPPVVQPKFKTQELKNNKVYMHKKCNKIINSHQNINIFKTSDINNIPTIFFRKKSINFHRLQSNTLWSLNLKTTFPEMINQCIPALLIKQIFLIGVKIGLKFIRL